MIHPLRDHTLVEFRSNIARAKNLVHVYESLKTNKKGRRPVAQADVLRAAVVFTHSSIEEVFRNLFKWKLPTEGEEEVLNTIPLIGTNPRNAEKFQLGKLAQFRGDFVDNVLVRSIDAYVDAMNVNSSSELAKNIRMIGLQTDVFEPHFKRLESLFKRRHQIVHQADRNTDKGPGKHKANSLSIHQVNGWIKATEEFVLALVSAVPDDKAPSVWKEIEYRAKRRKSRTL